MNSILMYYNVMLVAHFCFCVVSRKTTNIIVKQNVLSVTFVLFARVLPVRASEQGNVIGSVRIYIYIYMCVYKKKL